MNRRGFMGSILVACVAPAIVRADSLMRIIPMETTIVFEGGVYDLLMNNEFMVRINREYDAAFASAGKNLGDTLRVRMLNRYKVAA